MILGQHGVGRIGGLVVLKDDVLLVLAALDDLGGTGRKLVLNLVNDRDDERSNDGEDPERELLLELLDNLVEDGDLLDGARNSLEDVVVELDGGADVGKHVADVLGELLGIFRRDAHVLHLGSSRVLLDLVHLVLLVATKNAIGDLVQEVAEVAGVLVAVLLEGALEVLELALGQLVGDLSGDGVEEIDTTECTGNQGVDLVAGTLDAQFGVAADVGEHIALTELNKGELNVVAVGKEI